MSVRHIGRAGMTLVRNTDGSHQYVHRGEVVRLTADPDDVARLVDRLFLMAVEVSDKPNDTETTTTTEATS